jgi:hypothetical protein
MSFSPAEAAMISVGALAGGFGLWLLLFKRPGPRSEGDVAIPALTEPTRLTLALLCIIAGYHLILWAMPPSVAAVQLPRSRWYVWVAVGIAMILATLRLDKFDRDRSSGSSTDHSDRP